MPVEAASWISQLDATKPAAGDPKSEGDDHIRLMKAVVQAQFASLGTAAVTVTAAQINDVPNKAIRAGDTYTGTHTFSAATVVFSTPTFSTPTLATHAATKAYADGLAFAAALPGVSATTKGKVITNDGATASWGEPTLSARSLYFATMG